ncbi:MAG: YolD-like family protein [Lachnospiraceae bacterium]|nr:YolD-like family protein [Lachnospiraceae bacterium]
MTEAEEKYKDIIHKTWPADPSIYRKHPKMPLQDRAKIFAPFAALRGHSDRLSEETAKQLRSNRTELSEEEAAVLSDKLLQVKKGMVVTVTYFELDSDDSMDGESGNIGCYISLTGTVAEIDAVFRFIKINTGEESDNGETMKTVKFDDLLNVTGKDIMDIDEYLGIENCE